jgi:hypothetical protein
MAISCKYIERPKDIETGVRLIHDEVLPLLQKAWDKMGKPTYEKDFNLHVEAFMNLWVTGNLVMVIAYNDNKEAVGLLIGLRFIPMYFHSNVLQVETCFSEDDEVTDKIYDYICSIGSILNIDEVWVQNDTCLPQNCEGLTLENKKCLTYRYKR